MTEAQELREALEDARKQLEEWKKFRKDLENSPLELATVVAMGGGRILIEKSGKLSELAMPQTFEVQIGSRVLTAGMTGALVGLASLTPPQGELLTVEEILPDHQILVQASPGQHIVLPCLLNVRAGDRVLTVSGQVVKVMDREGSSQFLQPHDPSTQWSDVKGQSAAIQVLREMVEWPSAHSALMKTFSMKTPKGALLHGPPGCGKTMLARAAVNALNKGSQTPAFFYIKGPEILDKYVGEAERKIREIFSQARAHQRSTGVQPIVFIDEADAVLRTRGTYKSSDIGNTVVPQFLAEMDGLDDGGPMILLATNEAGVLDPAVVRPGRIDRAAEVKRPGKMETYELFAHYLACKPSAEPKEDQASWITGRMFDPVRGADLKLGQKRLSDQMSGAAVTGIVEQACAIAIRRCVAQPHTKDQGLLRADLAAAAREFCESRSLA